MIFMRTISIQFDVNSCDVEFCRYVFLTSMEGFQAAVRHCASLYLGILTRWCLSLNGFVVLRAPFRLVGTYVVRIGSDIREAGASAQIRFSRFPFVEKHRHSKAGRL